MEDALQPPPREWLASQEEIPGLLPDHLPEHVPMELGLVGEFTSTTTVKRGSDIVRPEIKKHAKVAISRQRPGLAQRYHRRVPRACGTCRQRKTKCSGDTPVCRQCQELKATCFYPVGWKERADRRMEKLYEKVQEYENLLRYLGTLVDDRTASQIKGLLDKYSSDVDCSSNNSHSATPPVETPYAADEPASLATIEPLEASDGVEEGLDTGDFWGSLDLDFKDLTGLAQSGPFGDYDYSTFPIDPSSDPMASLVNGSVAANLCFRDDPGFFPYTNHNPWE